MGPAEHEGPVRRTPRRFLAWGEPAAALRRSAGGY